MTENLTAALKEFDLLDAERLRTGPLGDLYEMVSTIADLSAMTIPQSASDEEPSVWSETDQNHMATAIHNLCCVLNTV